MEEPSRRKVKPGVVISIAVLAAIVVAGFALADEFFGPFDESFDELSEFEERFYEDDPEGMTDWIETIRLPKGTPAAIETEFTLGDAVRNRGADAYEDEDDLSGGRTYYRSYGTYPYIDGSSACVPMQAGFAMKLLGLTGDSAFKFSTRGSTYRNALLNLAEKRAASSYYSCYEYDYAYTQDGNYYMPIPDRPVDLYLGVSRSVEGVASPARRGVPLIKKTVALDALVFVVNEENPIDGLTTEQARGVYRGAITNWKEVGGLDERIFPFQHDEGTDSQAVMEDLVMGGEPLIDERWYEEAFALPEDLGAPMMRAIGRDGLGYTLRGVLGTIHRNENYKTLKIDGVAPTDDAIRKGSYPLTVELYGIIRAEDADKTGGRFLDWVLSDEGQDCVRGAGYLPVSERN